MRERTGEVAWKVSRQVGSHMNTNWVLRAPEEEYFFRVHPFYSSSFWDRTDSSPYSTSYGTTFAGIRCSRLSHLMCRVLHSSPSVFSRALLYGHDVIVGN